MPLIKGRSQKSFDHNVEAEMHEGKPQPQALAIAYSVKRRAKKAKGGYINEQAKSEQRPMPEERDQDSKMIAQNSSKKQIMDPGVLDQPTVVQAQKPSKMPLKHPKMVPQSIYSVRMRDEEDHLEQADAPAPYAEQPPQRDNEEQPDRQGPSMHMEAPHNDEQEKAYAEGGHVEDSMDQPSDEELEEHHSSIAAAIMAKKDREMRMGSDSDIDDVVRMALGGEILEDDQAPTSHDSIYSDDSDQADLSRNADEDANEEDQLSFNALRKENYSESEGLQQLDSPDDSNLHGDNEESESENKHDKISAMRSRMSKRRQFSR